MQGGQNKLKVHIGQRFGTRRVIKIRLDNGNGYQRWLMQCDCGSQSWNIATQINRGSRCLHCAHVTRRVKVPKGAQFNFLVVLTTEIYLTRTICLAQCICGKKIKVPHNNLKEQKACRNCAAVLSANKREHPNLTEQELASILENRIERNQNLEALCQK